MNEGRLELHETLCDLVGITEADGDRHVYFQPPPSVKMKYPAIVYSRKNIENIHADDAVYLQKPCYELIVIDPNPECELVEKVSKLPYCRFDRHYTKDNLNHDAFTIY